MDNNKPYLRLIFDLDDTLTKTRTPIEPSMKELLASLPCDIVVITGANIEQMQKQLDGLHCYMLSQNGNHAVYEDQVLWHDTLHPEEVVEIMDHIASLPRPWSVPDEHDLVENRGSQISYNLYGHNAPRAEKEAFDPDKAKRIKLLAEHPLVSDNVEVRIAGTATLDYFRKGHNKGFNIARLCEFKDWNLDNCLFFGDALYPGGNDEAVIGVVDTVSVQGPEDTYQKLTDLKGRLGQTRSTYI